MSYGVRFVGKDPDGIAKAISVNDDGVLLVELLGSLLVGEVAENPTANTILGRMKSLEDKLGEAEASPTANTLLARLKSLEDKIDAITDGTSPAVTQLTGSILQQINQDLPTLEWTYFDSNEIASEYVSISISSRVIFMIEIQWRNAGGEWWRGEKMQGSAKFNNRTHRQGDELRIGIFPLCSTITAPFVISIREVSA